MPSLLRTHAFLILALTVFGGCTEPTRTTASSAPTGTSAEDRPGSPPRAAYETFDVVWTTIDEKHFDPEHNGVDWDAIRSTYRPRVESTRTEEDVRLLLAEMIAELGQSHFSIIPRSSGAASSTSEENRGADLAILEDDETEDAEEDVDVVMSAEGYTGIRLELDGDEIVVAHVDRGSPAEAADVRPGWRLMTIDGRDPARILRSMIDAGREDDSHMANYYVYAGLNAMASGRPGEVREIEFEDASGATATRAVEVTSKSGETTDFMQLGPMTTKFDARILGAEELEALGLHPADGRTPEILLITFDNWMFPIMGPLRQAMDEHRDADGVVIDLRGNPGGAGGLAMGVAGFFLDEPLSLGDMKMRDSTMHFRVNPQKVTMDGRLVEPFSRPLAIVVDGGSASTSEIFAGGMQKLGRATVVGRRTAGAALPAHLIKLPNGDRFMYAVADFLGPDGKTIEGVGVPPDREVPIDRDLIADRRDPDLATAVEFILSESND